MFEVLNVWMFECLCLSTAGLTQLVMASNDFSISLISLGKLLFALGLRGIPDQTMVKHRLVIIVIMAILVLLVFTVSMVILVIMRPFTDCSLLKYKNDNKMFFKEN
jgi:hypothetical protein